MGYKLETSEDKDFITLTVEGDFTAKDMMGYIMAAHDLGTEIKISRFLVDVREARNVDSVMHNYQFAYSDMKNTEGIIISARVAALVNPGDRSHDFIETVLNNAGLSIKLFSDRELALEYLLDG